MNNNFFQILRAGINTTYQDEGRYGLQHFGIAPGGCMDKKSFFIANALVGNPKSTGVIEFAYQGPLLKLNSGKVKIAITGDVYFKIVYSDNKTIDGKCNRTYNLSTNDKIDILATKKSSYGYMAIEGGFNIKSFCNSVSTLVRGQIGPNEGKKIEVDDKIKIKKNTTIRKNFSCKVLNVSSNKIRVLRGTQYKYFSNYSQNDFCQKSYKVTKLTDRMGMRLQGEFLKNIVSTNIRSEGITKGAIQVPADGQPIILLTDHPTIGGYPKIANIISADYDLLVQKIPGDEIFFEFVELQEAEQLYKEQRDNISNIIKNIKELN
jgi:biotin-dependent carboxylase-like uncharacterized protein